MRCIKLQGLFPTVHDYFYGQIAAQSVARSCKIRSGMEGRLVVSDLCLTSAQLSLLTISEMHECEATKEGAMAPMLLLDSLASQQMVKPMVFHDVPIFH